MYKRTISTIICSYTSDLVIVSFLHLLPRLNQETKSILLSENLLATMAPAYSSYACIFAITLLTFMASPTTRAYRAAGETTSAALLIRVDLSGKGDYSKIQDAIDAVPSNNNQEVFILVKPGVYKEKIVVPVDKPFITISGSKANSTIVTWNDGGNIFECATFTVLASDFVARYLTIQVYIYITRAFS